MTEDESHLSLLKSTLGVDLNQDTDRPDYETTDTLGIKDLLPGLTKSSKNESLKEKVKKKLTHPAFEAPQEGPAADRLERSQYYNTTVKKTLNKWEDISRQYERKEGVVFPLNVQNSKIKQAEAKDIRKENFHFAPRSELERKLDDLFNSSKNVIPPASGGLSELEKKLVAHLSVKEIKERTKALRNNRFLISNLEAKNKRTKKIKSKAFRKRQRKALEKAEEKAMLIFKKTKKEYFSE